MSTKLTFSAIALVAAGAFAAASTGFAQTPATPPSENSGMMGGNPDMMNMMGQMTKMMDSCNKMMESAK